MTEPNLNIGLLDTHSMQSFALLDLSAYPTGFTITSPTIQISIPGNPDVTLPFVPSNISVYDSKALAITCDWCELTNIPDGIYKVKYSVYPAYKYYVEKVFARIDNLQSKLDKAYLHMDFMECDNRIKREDRLLLDTIQTFIEGAISAGNNCAEKLFHSLYNKAYVLLDNFINNKSCVKH